jgi:hypothetical protein
MPPLTSNRFFQLASIREHGVHSRLASQHPSSKHMGGYESFSRGRPKHLYIAGTLSGLWTGYSQLSFRRV